MTSGGVASIALARFSASDVKRLLDAPSVTAWLSVLRMSMIFSPRLNDRIPADSVVYQHPYDGSDYLDYREQKKLFSAHDYSFIAAIGNTAFLALLRRDN